MERKRFSAVNRLQFIVVVATAALLASCANGKKHQADAEDVEQEEEVADVSGADDKGAALFDLFYDLNAHADYAYTDKVLMKNGFGLEDKAMYDDDEEVGEYVFTYVHPEYGKIEVGWQGVVGYGFNFTPGSMQLLRQMYKQADSRGFKLEEDSDSIFSDGTCFFWKNEDGMWMYGHDDKNLHPSISAEFSGELGVFQLRGPVKMFTMQRESAPSYESHQSFDREGFMIEDDGQKPVDSDLTTYSRDDKGRLERQDISGGMFCYNVYNANGLLEKSHTNYVDEEDTEWYTYNSEGELIKKTNVFNRDGQDGITATTYEILSRDSHGNWTKRKALMDGKEDIETRTITYYE